LKLDKLYPFVMNVNQLGKNIDEIEITEMIAQ